jgi:hypothetical protein
MKIPRGFKQSLRAVFLNTRRPQAGEAALFDQGLPREKFVDTTLYRIPPPSTA